MRIELQVAAAAVAFSLVALVVVTKPWQSEVDRLAEECVILAEAEMEAMLQIVPGFRKAAEIGLRKRRAKCYEEAERQMASSRPVDDLGTGEHHPEPGLSISAE